MLVWLVGTFALDARFPPGPPAALAGLEEQLADRDQDLVGGKWARSSFRAVFFKHFACCCWLFSHTHVSHVRYVFLTEHRRSQSHGEFFWNAPTPPNLPTPPSVNSGSSIGQLAKAIGKFEGWCILAAFLGPSGVPPAAGFPKLWPGHLVL